MAERFAGNFEVIDALTEASRSVTGRAIDQGAARVALAALEGLTQLVPAEPKAVGTARPAATWTGTDATGREVEVRLWREPRREKTETGAEPSVMQEEERRERG
jgi:hypothetical protein